MTRATYATDPQPPSPHPRTLCTQASAARAHRIILIGPGQVGSALLAQLERSRACVRVIGLCNRRQMRLDPNGILLADWPDALRQTQVAPCLDQLIRFASTQPGPVTVIDCTASEAIGLCHAAWLRRGLNVLTANKHGPCQLRPGLAGRHRDGSSEPVYGIETTVGAALPVIETTRLLIRGGHAIERIDGLLSGSLSAIFNHIQRGHRPSQAVRLAYQQGLTEPDPRDDLSGLDIARKLVILARELGEATPLASVELPGLVPEPLRAIPVEAFLARLAELDRPIEDQIAAMAASNERVQICGSLHNGQISVRLSAFPIGHPFAEPPAGQAIVQWQLAGETSPPVCLQGAGAGAAWTASGLLGELRKLMDDSDSEGS